MFTPFADIEGALREAALFDKIRLGTYEAITAREAERGELPPGPSLGLARMRWRLQRQHDAAELLLLLRPHETAVRAIEPRLMLPRAAPKTDAGSAR